MARSLTQFAGKWAVRQAGILVHIFFDTAEEAREWARRNYRGSDWTVEQIQ